ncbi:putative ABC transport system ATP-binding protein [Lachnospiraceae bacterium KH1T2]|nr:putative ABC transport system ATP-binding protein [Lachnospiraceae bacterium KH1T2]
MGDSAISVKQLYKIFLLGKEKVRALNGVSFDIEKGQFVAIVGTSGSGKSTLLNMLAGLEAPTKGTIKIAGENIEHYNERQLVKFRRNHVGFIFQSYNLLPTMDAVENVALPLTFRGMDKSLREKKALKALKMVGLQKYIKHRPTEMSGGQQQRVGIARALVLEPEIIFADEPTGNLDSVTTEEILKLMQDVVRKNKTTLVMVTHDNHLASFADRIIRIKDGKIINDEKREQFKKNEEVC